MKSTCTIVFEITSAKNTKTDAESNAPRITTNHQSSSNPEQQDSAARFLRRIKQVEG